MGNFNFLKAERDKNNTKQEKKIVIRKTFITFGKMHRKGANLINWEKQKYLKRAG